LKRYTKIHKLKPSDDKG